MKYVKLAFALAIFSFCVPLINVHADIHLRVPEDVEPPVYTSAAGPAFQSNGSVFSVHDNEWVAIPFWRSTECVPADFNLLVQVDDPGAFGCQLLLEGFIRLQNGTFNLMSWEARGLGNVPVWFVSWPELQSAMADNVLTITELNAMTSLQRGNADLYQEQNHTFFGHQVSHLSLRASGILQDGRSFRLNATEVALGLIHVTIDFR
jgi:hypothetical protein